MNRKQFFFVLLALALIGGAGLVLLRRNQESWTAREAKVGDKVLPNFRINDVAEIHVKGVGADFTVARTNGIWRVRERDNYPADFALISDLLLKMRDMKVMQSDIVGPSQLSRLGLSSPDSKTNGATFVEFKDAHGNLVDSLLVGKKHSRVQDPSEPMGLHGFFDGRYLISPHDPQNALLISDELIAINPAPGEWLSRDFFKIENIRLISLTAPDATNSWEISRESDSAQWTLDNAAPGESLNTRVAADAGEILAFPRFVDVVPKGSSVLEHRFDKPVVVTILADRLVYTLKIGGKGADGNYPMTVSVTANIPNARTPSPDEKPEDTAKLNAEFQQQIEMLNEKVTKEKALAPWTYLADSWIEMVVHDRSQLLENKTSVPEQTAAR